jgi:hypothetical protein
METAPEISHLDLVLIILDKPNSGLVDIQK